MAREVVGETIGDWKVVERLTGTNLSDSTFRIECTSCGEQTTSRWNKFGSTHPRLCTCNPEYRGRGRPMLGSTIPRRGAPPKPIVYRDRPEHRPETPTRKSLADAAMMVPPYMPHQTVLDEMLRRARDRAVEVGMDFSLTISFLEALMVHQGGFCALSGMPISLSSPGRTASIDRKDSAYGYVPGNVQWVHRDLNRMKLDHDQDAFVELCAAVVEMASVTPDLMGEKPSRKSD